MPGRRAAEAGRGTVAVMPWGCPSWRRGTGSPRSVPASCSPLGRDDLERRCPARRARSAPRRSRCSSSSRGDQMRSVMWPTCSPSVERRHFRHLERQGIARRPRCRPACGRRPRRGSPRGRPCRCSLRPASSTSRSRPITWNGVSRDRHVRAVVEDAGLDPARLARRDRADVVRPAGLHDPVPQVAAARRVAQVDLVADLAGPAGPADDDGDAVELGRQRPVVLDVVDGGAERASRITSLRLRALDLDRVDLGLADLDVEARVDGHAARPQAGVGVGEVHPPAVLARRGAGPGR